MQKKPYYNDIVIKSQTVVRSCFKAILNAAYRQHRVDIQYNWNITSQIFLKLTKHQFDFDYIYSMVSIKTQYVLAKCQYTEQYTNK